MLAIEQKKVGYYYFLLFLLIFLRFKIYELRLRIEWYILIHLKVRI